MSAEHMILNKMKLVTDMFIQTLKDVKKTTLEIQQIAKNEIDADNFYIENHPLYKKFNETFDIEEIEGLIIDIMEPLLNEIDEERIGICEKHEYIEDRVETGVECDMMTIYCCKFCRAVKK